ncbi:MAG: HipA N-terminal domain-containing protein [Chitinophagales bacterium]|nr:HipA N-terminal domain-containing protein [Chitinophagales bacterium]HMU99371.1 HipA N-terminal domain-containing protein [Chitinophagales bacterium]HMY43734.1 HipA N-terminal domain-containing protein [Chitinophagales bacterium]HMZ95225.1 HipA N-terminal domain-containing protein [Chitinophagales bacterium]HNJ59976.1 HipA N-terminal domain-containing protein [Chitinophagales bacterium]
MRKGNVYYKNNFAGIIAEIEDGYTFQYDEQFLNSTFVKSISLTLPIQKQPFHSKILFPFFDGLIPEGWLLNIAVANWKINPRDRFGLLLTLCNDCIGAISIKAI